MLISNSTWFDMFIESTFMRYEHNQGGLTGISLNDKAIAPWSLRSHSFCRLIRDMATMQNE